MCKSAIIFISLLLIGASISAQAPDVMWERTFGNTDADVAYWVEETSDSGFVMIGYSFKVSGYPYERDMYVVRTDRFGNEIWTNTYGGDKDDIGTSIMQLEDDGFIFCGFSASYVEGYQQVRVVRTDEDGIESWSRNYEYDRTSSTYAMCRTLDGNFMMACMGPDDGVVILKIGQDGAVLNEYTIDDISQGFYGITATADGGAIITGGGTQLFLMKVYSSGLRDWSKPYGALSNGRSVIQLADGGYAAFGWKEYSLLDKEFWLLRVDEDGEVLWDKHYGNKYRDEGYCVSQTLDGGFIMTGFMFPESGDEGKQIWVVRTDSEGNTIWTKTIGGDHSEDAYCIQPTSDSGYVIAGSTNSKEDDIGDMYLIKLAKDPALTTDVNDDSGELPMDFKLAQNHPNPFNPATTIEFELPRRSFVSLNIYNLLGQRVAQLIDGKFPAGKHRIEWDGIMTDGGQAPSGVYFYRIAVDGRAESKKMLLLK